MDENIKSSEIRYRVDFSGRIDWDFTKGGMTSKIGDTILFFQPNFRFVYSNMVTISHTSSSEFNFYFSDFFPFTNLFSTTENEYKVIPALRVIYPVFNIDTFLLLSEQIANKYGKADEIIKEQMTQKTFKITPSVQPNIPTFYANNAYFFYDGSGDDFRIIFGEIGKGEFKIDMEDPSGKKITMEGKKGFQVTLGTIIPSKIFLSMISALKRNIKQYEEKFGTLPLKPTEKPKGFQL